MDIIMVDDFLSASTFLYAISPYVLVAYGLYLDFYGAFQLAHLDPLQGQPKPFLKNLLRMLFNKPVVGGEGPKVGQRRNLEPIFWRKIAFGFMWQLIGVAVGFVQAIWDAG